VTKEAASGNEEKVSRRKILCRVAGAESRRGKSNVAEEQERKGGADVYRKENEGLQKSVQRIGGRKKGCGNISFKHVGFEVAEGKGGQRRRTR